MYNIIIISNFPPPIGGVPSLVKNLLPFLEEKNFKVTIITYNSTLINESLVHKQISDDTIIFKYPKFKDLNVFKFFFDIIKSFTNIKLIKTLIKPSYISYCGFRKYFYNILTIRKLFSLNTTPNIIITFNIISRGDLGYLISEYYKCKYILFNFGELYMNYNFINSSYFRKKFLFNLTKNSSGLFSCSKHCLDSYKLFGIEHENKKIFYVPVNQEDYFIKSDKSILNTYYKINPNYFVVTYFGRFSQELGFDIFLNLIETVLSNDKTLFHFVAMGMLEDTILELRLHKLKNLYPENISIYNNTTNKISNDILNISDVTLVLSKSIRACSSNVSAESMSCGVPVIALNYGGVSEIVKENIYNTLLENENLNGIINAIKYYHINKQRHDLLIMKKNLSEYANNRFNINSINNELSSSIFNII